MLRWDPPPRDAWNVSGNDLCTQSTGNDLSDHSGNVGTRKLSTWNIYNRVERLGPKAWSKDSMGCGCDCGCGSAWAGSLEMRCLVLPHGLRAPWSLEMAVHPLRYILPYPYGCSFLRTPRTPHYDGLMLLVVECESDGLVSHIPSTYQL